MDRVKTIIFESGLRQDINLDPIVVEPPPVPIPTNIILGGYFDGITDSLAKGYANQFGMGWVRTWHAVRDWTLPPTPAMFERQRRLQAQGLKVLTVFTPIEKSATGAAYPAAPDDTVTVAQYFRAAADAASGAVNAWEILNEPNLSQYNPNYNQLAMTVNNVLRPAYIGLKDRGQLVVGAPWSGDCSGDNFKYFVAKGFLDTCDIVGYHPYGKTASEQIARVSTMRSRIGNSKPLWLTEWNLHGSASAPVSWMAELGIAAAGIRLLVDGVFHFRMTYNTSLAGKAAPFDVEGNQRADFYEGTKRAMEWLR